MKEYQHDPSYAAELLRLAAADLDSAEKLLRAKARVENACFHAQQCVEKCLKAVLIKEKISFGHVHDLGYFLGRLPSQLHPPNDKELLELEVYASQKRYEEGPYAATEEEGKKAIALAQSTLDWAKAKRGRD